MLAQESETASIDLSADGEAQIKHLMTFFYNGCYVIDPSKPTERYETHAQLFLLADKYDIPLLAEYAHKSFRACCNNDWNSIAFLDVVAFSYAHTLANDAFRKEIATQGCLHARDLLYNDQSADRFHWFSEDVPEFFYDMINGFAGGATCKKQPAEPEMSTEGLTLAERVRRIKEA